MNTQKCLLNISGQRKGTGTNNGSTVGGSGSGSIKRYQDIITDTEKLKKLNAVQCLREIVSTEIEVSAEFFILMNQLTFKVMQPHRVRKI